MRALFRPEKRILITERHGGRVGLLEDLFVRQGPGLGLVPRERHGAQGRKIL